LFGQFFDSVRRELEDRAAHLQFFTQELNDFPKHFYSFAYVSRDDARVFERHNEKVERPAEKKCNRNCGNCEREKENVLGCFYSNHKNSIPRYYGIRQNMVYYMPMVFQAYEDPKLDKYLRYGYWYQEHKDTLYKGAILTVLLVLGALWVHLFYQLYQFVQETASYERMSQSIATPTTNIEQLHLDRSPAKPVVEKIYSSAGQRGDTADFGAVVENSNPDWIIEVSYAFIWPGGSTEPASGLLLPGQRAFLTTRGVPASEVPSGVRVTVDPVSWERVTDRALLNRIYEAYAQLTFPKKIVSRLDDSTIATYEVHNGSIYDISVLRFDIVLTRGENAVAFGRNDLETLKSGDTVELTARWLQRFAGGTALQVYPWVDLRDPALLRLPTGDGQQL